MSNCQSLQIGILFVFSSLRSSVWDSYEICPLKQLKDMAKKVTSPTVARTASKILRDNRYSDAAKSAAGSALSQREKFKKK